MDQHIRFYHQMGLSISEIQSTLYRNHQIILSISQLRHLRRLRLYRRQNFTDIDTLVQALEELVSNHGQLHGYRWMHLRCLQNGFIVTQNTIRILLKLIDPVGVDFRRRRRLRRRQYHARGPNFLWHVDCYDKLKPFGMSITGCIDGFSRYVIWLAFENTTNDPSVIAYHYMESVKLLGGCPQTVRADMGTENVIRKTSTLFTR